MNIKILEQIRKYEEMTEPTRKAIEQVRKLEEAMESARKVNEMLEYVRKLETVMEPVHKVNEMLEHVHKLEEAMEPARKVNEMFEQVHKLEEAMEPTLKAIEVEQHSNNWIKKVEQLYSFVKDVLKNEKKINFKTDDSMVMYEELMDKYGISPKSIPILDLYIGKQLHATFKPIGLWVLGANGRIDILTRKGAHTLVDLSEDEENPQWKIFSPQNRKKAKSFDAQFINELVLK